jgi:hypothetical protein
LRPFGLATTGSLLYVLVTLFGLLTSTTFYTFLSIYFLGVTLACTGLVSLAADLALGDLGVAGVLLLVLDLERFIYFNIRY